MTGKERWALGELDEVPFRLDRKDITASEVADFIYCGRSWWLRRVRGAEPQGAQLEAGVAAHGAVGTRMVTAEYLQWMMKALALGVALCAVGATIAVVS